MRDGYYLSAYVTIDEYKHVFDISDRHDYNISLYLKENGNVTLVHYWELERISGVKEHQRPFFNVEETVEFINHLLSAYDLTIDDMVEVWGTPEIANVKDYHSVPEQPDYAYHGMWHLFSGIMMNTEIFHNDQILAFAVDGGPEFNIDPESEHFCKYYYPGCYVNQGKIEYFPAYSPGPFWGYAAKRYKMREGTLMALGSAIDLKSEKNYIRDSIFIEKTDTRTYQTYYQLDAFFREIEEEFDSMDSAKLSDQFTYEENRIAFVMNVIQDISKVIMEKNVEMAIERLGINPENAHLSLAGGFALNCPTNSYLMNTYKFKSFIAPPCVNDTGMSLGVALYAFYKKLGRFNFQFQNAYYGDKDDSFTDILREYSPYIKNWNDFDPDQFLADIQSNPIVWFDHRTEVGPRALGNRSLLADPRNPASKVKLNVVKEREWWRPVAPLIMEEHLEKWFMEDVSSPYMLQTSMIKEHQFEKVPAILHLDRSSRIQTVNRRDNESLYELLELFNKETQVPILCNTSLNDKGEPIINRSEEAIVFALRKKMPVIYINKVRLELQGFEAFHERAPHPRLRALFTKKSRYKDLIYRRFNPHNVNSKYFRFIHYFPDIIPMLESGLEHEVEVLLQRKFTEMGLNYKTVLPSHSEREPVDQV